MRRIDGAKNEHAPGRFEQRIVTEGKNVDTNLYFRLRGTYEERRQKLEAMPPEYLRAAILDSEYNEFLRSRSDADDKDEDYGEILNGKRVPYLGWFWRHLEFHEGKLPLGFCDGYVGFMANNKWDYHERNTTPEEFVSIMGFIDAAMTAGEAGGELTTIHRNIRAELKKLRDYVQTLPRVA
jgi:hypothetical protein